MKRLDFLAIDIIVIIIFNKPTPWTVNVSKRTGYLIHSHLYKPWVVRFVANYGQIIPFYNNSSRKTAFRFASCESL